MVLVAALKALVKVRPLSVTRSVRVVSDSGFLGSVSATVRLVVKFALRPLLIMVTLAGNGACMLNRGSGPWTRVVAAPSGKVLLVVPLVLLSVVVCVPSGTVVVRCWSPVDNVSTRYVVARFSPVVRVTV